MVQDGVVRHGLRPSGMPSDEQRGGPTDEPTGPADGCGSRPARPSGLVRVEAEGLGGVFSTKENAQAWIATHGLSGLLTRYPLDMGSYDWAIQQGHFMPQREDQTAPKFIQRFVESSVHYHYEEGICVA